MSLTKIDREAIVVGTYEEVRGGATDMDIGRNAIVLFVAPESSNVDRMEMAEKARDIVAARRGVS